MAAALKSEYQSKGAKKKPKLGDVEYFPIYPGEAPFELWVEGNPLFAEYDNIPLTVMDLRQKIISDAAKFHSPVWFTMFIGDDAGWLPFASTTPDNFPRGDLSVPVLLNARLATGHAKPGQRRFPVSIRVPLLDRNEWAVKEEQIIFYPGAVLDANSIYLPPPL